MGLAWRIYYWDGSTFDSSQVTDPTGIPPERRLGVIAIIQPHPDSGRQLMCKQDWYYYRRDPDDTTGRWWQSDQTGFHDQVTHFTHLIDAVLLGRHSIIYSDIISAANNDPDFPTRSGYGVLEPKP